MQHRSRYTATVRVSTSKLKHSGTTLLQADQNTASHTHAHDLGGTLEQPFSYSLPERPSVRIELFCYPYKHDSQNTRKIEKTRTKIQTATPHLLATVNEVGNHSLSRIAATICTLWGSATAGVQNVAFSVSLSRRLFIVSPAPPPLPPWRCIAGRQSPGTVSSGPLLSLPPPSHLPLFTAPNRWILKTPPQKISQIKKNRFHISPNLHIPPHSQILSKYFFF